MTKKGVYIFTDRYTNLFNQKCFMNIKTDDKSLIFTDTILLSILNWNIG